MVLVAVLMAPITWHLWIYAGSVNTNFYFAMTLVFNVAQFSKKRINSLADTKGEE
jgi:phosphatidylinositol glycan class U